VADALTRLYLWTYVYDDNDELLHEANSHQEQVEMFRQELSKASKREFHTALRSSKFELQRDMTL
jgi:hypothetical protein